MKHPFVAVVAAVAFAFSTACGGHDPPALHDDGPDAITVGSGEITVTLSARPFGLRIMRADGSVVLEQFSGDRTVVGDALGAYGTLGATHRDTAIAPTLIEGYDHAAPTDEPWLHAATARITAHDATGATAELADPREPGVSLRLDVRVDGTEVAVEATVSANRADAARSLNLMGQSFLITDGERFVGLGEREGSVNHRGRHYQNWVEEGGIGGGERATPGPTNPGPNGPGMTHIPVPFVISSAGYGLWLDTSFRTGFALASDDPQLMRIWAEEPRLRYRVFVHDEPAATLAAFTAHAGRASLPAPWVFGPRRRMDFRKLVNGVPEAELLRMRGVPTSVADDTTHFLPNAAGDGREEELREWTAYLHRLGYKAMGYFNAHVSVTKPEAAALLADGRAKDVFVRLDDGSEFQTYMISAGGQLVTTLDFTKLAAVDWFRGRMDEALDLGYDGWMLDFGEYLPQRALLANGMTGYEAHNLFPLLMQRASWDHLRAQRGNDFLYYVRSGYTGTQSVTPMVWSGDPSASFEDARGLPAQVRAGINAGLSGIPFWGSDVSGFTCVNDPPADKEVYLRWAAFGALSPDMHDDNACAGRKPGTDKWTLWSDDETVEVYGAFARLHTRLLPYLYAAAKEATLTGMPIMRHPSLMDPHDPASWDAVHEYWFGPALFAAPVVRRGATTRELRLPAGLWFDWWTHTAADGGRMVVRAAPLDVIPLYQRAGTIVAMLPDDVQTLVATDDPSVIDMADRAGTLDAHVSLGPNDRTASAALVDGTTLMASLAYGAIEAPNGGTADTLNDGTRRVRVSTHGRVIAGALTLDALGPSAATVRWDVLIR